MVPSKKKIVNKVKQDLGYKAPEQLDNIIGYIAECKNGNITLLPKYQNKKIDDYLVGQIKKETETDPRILIVFSDGSRRTIE